MEKEYIDIQVPESFGQENNLNLPIETSYTLNANRLSVELGILNKHKIPVWNLALTGLITGLISFYFFRNNTQIPLTGTKSTATVVIILGFISSIINFTYLFIEHKKEAGGHAATYISWRIFPIVLLSFGLLIGVGSLFGFRILGQLFYAATFDIYTSTVIAILFVLVMNYLMMNLANNLSPSSIIRTLTAIILGGVGIAMMTNKDQQWWLANLSFLGTPEAANSWEFNLTLILSALLMIALIDYLFVLLYNRLGNQKKLKILKVLLIATALSLGGVGFFPYNESLFNQAMHNRVAGYLVYLFLILIVSVRWLLPNLEKSFLRLSYTVGGMLIASLYLFLGVGYLSLTAFELIAFVLAFSWLLMLLQHLIWIINKPQETYIIRVSQKEPPVQ